MVRPLIAGGLRQRPRQHEKAEQVKVRALFTACGFACYNLSQARASNQTPGLPDLWFVNTATGCALWWETKAYRESGRGPKPLAPAQKQFREECLRAGVHHGWGTLAEAEAWLEQQGYGHIVAHGFIAKRTTPPASRG